MLPAPRRLHALDENNDWSKDPHIRDVPCPSFSCAAFARDPAICFVTAGMIVEAAEVLAAVAEHVDEKVLRYLILLSGHVVLHSLLIKISDVLCEDQRGGEDPEPRAPLRNKLKLDKMVPLDAVAGQVLKSLNGRAGVRTDNITTLLSPTPLCMCIRALAQMTPEQQTITLAN